MNLAGGKRAAAARTAVEQMYGTMGFSASVRAEDIPPDEFVRLEREFHLVVGEGGLPLAADPALEDDNG